MMRSLDFGSASTSEKNSRMARFAAWSTGGAVTLTFSLPSKVPASRVWRARGCTWRGTSRPAGVSRNLYSRLSNVALSKNGRSDPHQGGSFLDSYLEVVTHPHREMLRSQAARLLHFERLHHFAQSREIGARTFRILEEWRNGHKPIQAQATAADNLLDDGSSLAAIGAELGFLLPEIYLDQHRQVFPEVGACLAEFAGEFDTVDGLDDVKQLGSPAGLVRLQVADHVPGEVWRGAELRDFGFGFLNAVLAEMALPGLDGGREEIRGKILADCHQCDFLGLPPAAPGCGRQPISNFLQVALDRDHLKTSRLPRTLPFVNLPAAPFFRDHCRSNSHLRQERVMFVTFEGIEGSGKSLQIGYAEAFLKAKGVPCLRTREPGGTPFGAALRQVLLHAGGPPREPVSELLLYLADRYQHLHEVIEPSLKLGITVLSDRYLDATRAYQGAARRVPAETIEAMVTLLGIREPDRTILLDLAPEIGLARARARNHAGGAAGSEGRFEAEDVAFHRDVREAYLTLARAAPERFRIIDGGGTPREVFARIELLLASWFAGACEAGP